MRLGVGAALVRGTWIQGDVDISDGVVSAIGIGTPTSARRAVPGFVDLQINGIENIDFLRTDAAGFELAASTLASTGVTAFAPTFVTAPTEDVEQALTELSNARLAIRSLGAHLEGPFIAPERLGAHDGSWRRDPDVALIDRLLAAGEIAMVTLAPELPGALEMIEHLTTRGITVALGHSDADAAIAHRAFDGGAGVVTHLFNAMSFGGHRTPGIAIAALGRPDVSVTLIADGVHVSNDAVAMAWQAAAGRLALVTDRVADTLERGATRSDDGGVRVGDTLAGSSTTMIECVRRLCALGASEAQAIDAATAVPARILGRPEIGALDVGGRADVVVLDDALDVADVIVDGTAIS